MEHVPTSPRMLAPLALLGFLIVLLVVVAISLTGGNDGEGGNRLGATQTGPGAKTTQDNLPQNIYIVKPGDTFGSIAEKTGIPVDRLAELNPRLDPQALISGQRVRLR
jgi:LysM repeat protein